MSGLSFSLENSSPSFCTIGVARSGAVAWPVPSGVFTILKEVCCLSKEGLSVLFKVVKVVLLKFRRRRGVLMEELRIDGSFNESFSSCNSCMRCSPIVTVSSRYVIR